MFDGPKKGKEQYFIAVPENHPETREVEKMLREIENEYSYFEYEGADWDNKLWFNISEIKD